MLSTRAAHLSSRVARKAVVAAPALTAVRRRDKVTARSIQSVAQTDRVSVCSDCDRVLNSSGCLLILFPLGHYHSSPLLTW